MRTVKIAPLGELHFVVIETGIDSFRYNLRCSFCKRSTIEHILYYMSSKK